MGKQPRFFWDRFDGPPHQLLILAALILTLLVLAERIVVKTMASAEARSNPRQALLWDADNARAMMALAGRLLATAEPAAGAPSPKGRAPLSAPARASDLRQAQAMAQRALRHDPLAPRALTDLARLAAAQGEAARAQTLMKLAAKRALRDAVAQGWLVEDALKRGDFAQALPALDAILRTHPEAFAKALPLLVAFVSNPATAAPLARLISQDPPWRAGFLNAVAARIADRAALERFYAMVQTGPRPLSQTELQPYLDRLVADGLSKEAYAIWMKALPADRRPDPGALYNGAFRYPLSGSEFDWKITPALGADVEIVRSTAGGGARLRIEFSGARVDFKNVSHWLALAPGRYRLTGEVEAESLRTERGLWWRVYCAKRPDQSLGRTSLVAQTMDWRSFALDFKVPAAGCEAQVLRLELPARDALEQRISGELSYRDLAISSPPAPLQAGQLRRSETPAPAAAPGLK